MRSSGLCRLLCCLVLSLALPVIVSADLSGTSFAFVPGQNLTQANDPLPTAAFYVDTFSVSFLNRTDYELRVTGFAAVNNGQTFAIGPSFCRGKYAFSLPMLVTFQSSDTACTEPEAQVIPYCKWACRLAYGTYPVAFMPYDAPSALLVGTAVGASSVSTGFMGLPLQALYCNTTTCGTTAGIFPPTPLPADVSFEVRRPILCLLAELVLRVAVLIYLFRM